MNGRTGVSTCTRWHRSFFADSETSPPHARALQYGPETLQDSATNILLLNRKLTSEELK